MSVVKEVASKDVRETCRALDASKECAEEDGVDGEVEEAAKHGGEFDVWWWVLSVLKAASHGHDKMTDRVHYMNWLQRTTVL